MDELEDTKELVGVDKIYSEVHSLVDNLSTVQAETLNATSEHKFKDLVTRKLDNLVALENAATSALRQRALLQVHSDVLDAFKNDKKVKEAALNQAVAVLTGGANAKLGTDVVGNVFSNALKTYRENYAKQPAGSDKIIAQLEKDIATVLTPPTLEEKGGNVYVTHPVSARYVA